MKAQYLVVYTAVFGDYDWIPDPPVPDGISTYFRLFDPLAKQQFAPSDVWTNLYVPRSEATPVRDARRCKILSHRQFPEAEFTIWHDANIDLMIPAFRFLDYLGDNDIAVFDHPPDWPEWGHRRRQCIYDEAEECKRLGRDRTELIDAQMERCRADKYPVQAGLVSTGVLVRRNTDRVRRFNEMWWGELNMFSHRDQLSFPYVSWKLGIDYSIIPGSIFTGSLVRYRYPHGT